MTCTFHVVSQHIFVLELDGKLMKKLKISGLRKYEGEKMWGAEDRHGYPPADAELNRLSFTNAGKNSIAIQH